MLPYLFANIGNSGQTNKTSKHELPKNTKTKTLWLLLFHDEHVQLLLPCQHHHVLSTFVLHTHLWTRYESIGHIGHFSVADHACSSAILFPVSRMGIKIQATFHGILLTKGVCSTGVATHYDYMAILILQFLLEDAVAVLFQLFVVTEFSAACYDNSILLHILTFILQIY